MIASARPAATTRRCTTSRRPRRSRRHRTRDDHLPPRRRRQADAAVHQAKSEEGKGYLRLDKNLYILTPASASGTRRPIAKAASAARTHATAFDESRLAIEFDPTFVGDEARPVRRRLHEAQREATRASRHRVSHRRSSGVTKAPTTSSSARVRAGHASPAWRTTRSGTSCSARRKNADVWFPGEIPNSSTRSKVIQTMVVFKSVACTRSSRTCSRRREAVNLDDPARVVRRAHCSAGRSPDRRLDLRGSAGDRSASIAPDMADARRRAGRAQEPPDRRRAVRRAPAARGRRRGPAAAPRRGGDARRAAARRQRDQNASTPKTRRRTRSPLAARSTCARRRRFKEASFNNSQFSSPDLLDVYLDARPNDRVRGVAVGDCCTTRRSATASSTLNPELDRRLDHRAADRQPGRLSTSCI